MNTVNGAIHIAAWRRINRWGLISASHSKLRHQDGHSRTMPEMLTQQKFLQAMASIAVMRDMAQRVLLTQDWITLRILLGMHQASEKLLSALRLLLMPRRITLERNHQIPWHSLACPCKASKDSAQDDIVCMTWHVESFMMSAGERNVPCGCFEEAFQCSSDDLG